jgi:hypothetical protein
VHIDNINQATGEHFNSKGHSVADMEVIILEIILSWEKENLFIKKCHSNYKGLKKKS